MPLFVVATPIGNLDDLTIRARDTLAAADIVLAEDTRRTLGLLSHLGLRKPLFSLHAHSEQSHIERYAERAAGEEKIALVSDAGTPLVSDPGAELVAATVARGGSVVAIPGASAVLTALVTSGLAGNGFRFVGFLPRSGHARRDALARVIETPEPVVFYEAPNRVRETVRELAERQPMRRAMVARELTKLHEEAFRGTLAELAAQLPEELIGEVSVVLGAYEAPVEATSSADMDRWIDTLLAEGRSAKETADIVAARSGLARREAYARVLTRKR